MPAPKKKFTRVKDTRGDNGIVEFGTEYAVRWVPKNKAKKYEPATKGAKKIDNAAKGKGVVHSSNPKRTTRKAAGGNTMS